MPQFFKGYDNKVWKIQILNSDKQKLYMQDLLFLVKQPTGSDTETLCSFFRHSHIIDVIN